MFRRIVILDGYTDEPSGLGVPPYLGVYPRLVAGVFRYLIKDVVIRYWTIDSARSNLDKFINEAKGSNLVVVIAGCLVPGRYLGGRPITYSEVEYLCFTLRDVNRVLIGPVARFGFGTGGGSVAIPVDRIKNLFTEIVPGDPEVFFYDLITKGWRNVEPNRFRESYSLADIAYRYGAEIVKQHPNYGWNLIVEIETYSGCPRFIVGGCSFCVEPRLGRVIAREQKGVVDEVEALYKFGVRHVRLGKQPDILTYKAEGVGEKEFPKPNPAEIEKLLHGIRSVAPGLRTLHIDNVNPGTVYHNPGESIEALKVIIKYHTPGDVAALGIESFDEKVVKNNNLKVYPHEALEAVRIICKVGSQRGWNGLPHLLPGINIVYGLPGESRETYVVNYEYLRKIVDEGLMVRRLNIRRVCVLENTPLWSKRGVVEDNVRKFSKFFHYHRVHLMKFFDNRMLRRILPTGSVLRYLYTERKVREFTFARQPVSYPILVKIKGAVDLRRIVDVKVTGIASKSVVGYCI